VEPNKLIVSILQKISTEDMARTMYKSSFWQVARARSQSTFNHAIQALQKDAPQVEEYLQSIVYEKFAFACFPLPRFGHDTSNIAESINSAWREIRELLPLPLLVFHVTSVKLAILHQSIVMSKQDQDHISSLRHSQRIRGRHEASLHFKDDLPSSQLSHAIDKVGSNTIYSYLAMGQFFIHLYSFSRDQ
jgi:hypothetical protein